MGGVSDGQRKPHQYLAAISTTNTTAVRAGTVKRPFAAS